ncbi:MAG TPA: CoA transferase [Candidatus Entotheonella sp.]|jgi:CoA:oxalate CoA-transferase
MQRPLTGIRVLDLSQFLAGPYGSMILGDLGAEVVKIEIPEKGDGSREMPPHFIHGQSGYFLSMNRSKKSVTLNLKSDAGRQIFYDLVRHADVVYDNFRPEILHRLKIDYDTLKAINPRIISCSVSGYGHSGPMRDRPAFDLVMQAMGGIMSYTGPQGGEPVRMGAPMGDLAGGIFAAHGVLAALYERERTGVGRRVDVALLDSQIALLIYRAVYYFLAGEIAEPAGSGHVSAVPIGAFKTQDIHIVIDANGDKFWRALCVALERPDMADDPRFVDRVGRLQHVEELMAILQTIFLTRPGAEWLRRLDEAGVPSGPINTVDRALSDEQVRARNMVVEVNSNHYGKVNMTGSPIKFNDTDDREFLAPPTLSEHTQAILTDWLGMTSEQVKQLRDQGVV